MQAAEQLVNRSGGIRGRPLRFVFADDQGNPQPASTLALPENEDVTIVDREHFNPSDINIAAQIARITASGAAASTSRS